MGIGTNKIISADKKIGEITATTTGHENFFANFIGSLQHQHAPATLCSGKGTDKPRGTAAQYDDVVVLNRDQN